MANLPAETPWTVTSAARVCRLLVVPMAGAVGVSVTKLGAGRVAVAFLALALVLVALSFLGPMWLLRTGQPGGVVAVAVAQLIMSLGAVPGTVPGSVVSANLFLVCLLFAPLSLYVLIVLWLPSGRAYVESRRAPVS